MVANKLYLVDDDEIFRLAAEVLIKSIGLSDEVVPLENGLQAYDALMESKDLPLELPEVMFLDINMPLMNGWELLEELKNGPRVFRDKVQIYILTSSIDPKDLVLSKSYGFIDGYITKPLTEADLLRVVEALSKRPAPQK